jgi:hypothetical protein
VELKMKCAARLDAARAEELEERFEAVARGSITR